MDDISLRLGFVYVPASLQIEKSGNAHCRFSLCLKLNFIVRKRQ